MELLFTALTDILKLSIPAGIIGWVILRVSDRYLETRNRETVAGMRSRNRQETLTVRLQAFERLLLFLERSEPSNMIVRLHRPGMSASMLRTEMLRSLRNEFDHNLTQQIYVSPVTWAKVKEARDAVQQIVQAAAGKMNDTSSGIDLSNAVFTIIETAGLSPTQSAIDAVKNEAQELL